MSEQSPGYWWLPPGASRVAQGSMGGRGIAGCDEMSGFTLRWEMEGTGKRFRRRGPGGRVFVFAGGPRDANRPILTSVNALGTFVPGPV